MGWGVVISHPCSQGPGTSGLSPPCKSLNSPNSSLKYDLEDIWGRCLSLQLFCGGRKATSWVRNGFFSPHFPVTEGPGIRELTGHLFSLTLSTAHVTLDPNTAFFELFLSEDNQSVKRRNLWQNLPEKPERFSFDPCVLGHRSFSSGRHYWEVEVGDRTYWELGVCEENVDRAWGITESPQNGFWAVELYANKYQALTSPRTALPLSEPPSRVGVFLDYEAGHVSFYSVADGSHIYTFPQASFSGPLRPFFCLWFYHPTPLTICH